jgi:hypothetical protein
MLLQIACGQPVAPRKVPLTNPANYLKRFPVNLDQLSPLSCAGSTRASIILRKGWIAESSPAMTMAIQFERELL